MRNKVLFPAVQQVLSPLNKVKIVEVYLLTFNGTAGSNVTK